MTHNGNAPYPAHGGNIPWACKQFGIAAENWIDLSTGISPWSWPVPSVPQHVFNRLPYCDFGLLEAASLYYGCTQENIAILPGSQFAIESIPRLVSLGTATQSKTVALPIHGYKEHEQAWIKAGHKATYYHNAEHLLSLISDENIQYAVVINPNNPTAELLSATTLNKIEALLFEKFGNESLLLIDEAFMDITNQQSFIDDSRNVNTVILRSVGKFFGLAGIRLGFLISQQPWRDKLTAPLGTWSVNAPAMYIGQKALADTVWIQTQSTKIKHQSTLFFSAISNALASNAYHYTHSSCYLFHSIFGPSQQLYCLFVSLAKHGVLTRFIDHPQQACLRFGLPGPKLEIAIKKIMQSATTPC